MIPNFRKWAVLLLTLFCFQLLGADLVYSAFTDKTSVTSAKLTLQTPSSDAAVTRPQTVYVSCSVACTVVISQDGTAATATAGTVKTLGPWRTAKTLVYTDSNVGAGTQILPTMTVAAGTTLTIPVSGVELSKASTAKNFTIAVAGASGNMYAGVIFTER